MASEACRGSWISSVPYRTNIKRPSCRSSVQDL
ncbi:hypothetical protein AZE42_14099 [Rhizopogon vesiculosus]|uniref:Uncharacterized protein n=1 Tax=Rhizopogon vesiculosus TaxID=180088 RepID=A0A1J8QB06_9AGAM|nr:hypothetical protein AZE42_14099 [Rhizopogon vesiculosus]